MPVISEQTDIILRIFITYVVMFILFLLSMISFSTPLSTTIEIPFILIMIYYWMIYRPSLLSPLLIFIVGICIDLLSGFPLGISSFVLVIVRKIIFDQRVFLTSQNFIVIWLGFLVVSSITLFLQWGLFGLISLQWTPVFPVIITIIATTLLFPVISLALHLNHKILPFLQDQYSAVK